MYNAGRMVSSKRMTPEDMFMLNSLTVRVQGTTFQKQEPDGKKLALK